jgi:hypothetical protein
MLGGISMKAKNTFLLLLIITSSFFISCSPNKIPEKAKEETSPPIERTGTINSVPDTNISESIPPPNTVPPAAPPIPPVKEENKQTSKKPLGSYQTPLLSRDKERIDNIKLAIKKINGHKLKPGEVFSFNDIVGKRDAENGFKVAAVIVKGEFEEDIGGGVCQLSSTIFNAAGKAGMEIIERHSHSKAVRYVPEGRDAAVSYGYLDLKFKNNRNYPVEFKAKIEDKKLKVYIYKAK